jgi:uncharacterized membrane protein
LSFDQSKSCSDIRNDLSAPDNFIKILSKIISASSSALFIMKEEKQVQRQKGASENFHANHLQFEFIEKKENEIFCSFSGELTITRTQSIDNSNR